MKCASGLICLAFNVSLFVATCRPANSHGLNLIRRVLVGDACPAGSEADTGRDWIGCRGHGMVSLHDNPGEYEGFGR